MTRRAYDWTCEHELARDRRVTLVRVVGWIVSLAIAFLVGFALVR